MGLPHVVEQLLAYTFSVSAALALLNMAPVYGLDGEAALKSLFQLGEPRDAYFRGNPSRMRGGLRVQPLTLLTTRSLEAIRLFLWVGKGGGGWGELSLSGALGQKDILGLQCTLTPLCQHINHSCTIWQHIMQPGCKGRGGGRGQSCKFGQSLPQHHTGGSLTRHG